MNLGQQLVFLFLSGLSEKKEDNRANIFWISRKRQRPFDSRKRPRFRSRSAPSGNTTKRSINEAVAAFAINSLFRVYDQLSPSWLVNTRRENSCARGFNHLRETNFAPRANGRLIITGSRSNSNFSSRFSTLENCKFQVFGQS